MFLFDHSYSTCSGRGQSSSAHDALSKKEMKDAVEPVRSFMALGAPGRMFCLDVVFYQWNRSDRAANKKIVNVNGGLKEGS